jgi:hypothetical protein
MTSEMKKLLNEWNVKADGALLGCESAASEPFMQNLLFSDNRFELTHFLGKAVPLYAYLYHEFLHNFMGNQVCALLPAESYFYRQAYSFAAGDMPTIVLSPIGRIVSYWGQRDFSENKLPEETDVLAFIKTLRDFYLENKEIMCKGNMVKPLPYTTGEIRYACEYGRSYVAEEVLSNAFELDGEKMQIFVNHTKEDKQIEWKGMQLIVPALSVIKKAL